jgi:hypothetical protein
MIADKILPSFYVIEVEGKAVETIIAGNFAIEKISVGSRDFSNDMDALAALSHAMAFVIANPDLDTSKATETVDYNPEFFPTMKFSEEAERTKAAIEEATDEVTANLGVHQVAVPLTRVFDPLGDFVESRWVIEAPDFKVNGRVAVNPDRYMALKAEEMSEHHGPPKLKSQRPAIHLH